jgi:hypothetical protein
VGVADAALAEAEAEPAAPVALVSSELGTDMLFVGSTTELLPGAPVLATWWLVAVLWWIRDAGVVMLAEAEAEAEAAGVEDGAVELTAAAVTEAISEEAPETAA